MNRSVNLCFTMVLLISSAEAQDTTTMSSAPDTSLPVTTETLKPVHFAVNLSTGGYSFPLYALATDSSAGKNVNAFVQPPPKKRFWKAAKNVAIGYGLFLGGLFLSPQEFTHWDHSFGRELMLNAGTKFKRAWTSPPVWDHDKLFTNYFMHPYCGSYYYNLMRIEGSDVTDAFYFSLLASTFWEYIPEALFEQPSIQDLVVTPIFGAIMGEGVHRLTLNMSKNGLNGWEKVFVAVFNPGYWVNHGFKVPSAERRIQLREVRF